MELKGTGQMGEQGEEGKQRVSFGPTLRCDLASFLCTRDRVPYKHGQQLSRPPARPEWREAKPGARSRSALGRAAAESGAPPLGLRHWQDGEECARLPGWSLCSSRSSTSYPGRELLGIDSQ